jgi:hypothetical protein
MLFVKKLVVGIIIGVMISIVSFAEAQEIFFNKIKIQVNGQPKAVEHVLVNGKTYIQLRSIADVFNKKVEWDSETGTAHINDLNFNNEPNKTFINKIDEYLQDIEFQTNKKILNSQKELIIKYVENNNIEKISSDQITINRSNFEKNKTKIITEWEMQTNQKWPLYDKDILSESGKVLRKASNKYDAHHIIELSYGGKNEWWNIHPAAFPNEHQGGIHRKNGIANELFDE